MEKFQPDIISGGLENNPEGIKRRIKEGIPYKGLPAIGILRGYIQHWVGYFLDYLKKLGKTERNNELMSVLSYNLAIRLYQYISFKGLYSLLAQDNSLTLIKEKKIDDFESIERELSNLRTKFAKLVSFITEWTKSNNRKDVSIVRSSESFYIVHGKRDKTDYSIFLSPRVDSVYDIFEDLFNAIPHDIGYYMRTVNIGGFRDVYAAGALSLLDKIVIYCSEKDFDRIWQKVYEVYKRHQGAFNKRPQPADGIIAPLPGVSIANQSESEETKNLQHIDEVLRSKIKEQLEKQVRRNIEGQNFINLEDVINKKPEWLSILVKFVDEEIESLAKNQLFLRLDLSKFPNERKEFIKILREEILREFINALLEKRVWSKDNIRNKYLIRLKESQVKFGLDSSIVNHLRGVGGIVSESLFIEPIWTKFCLAAYFYAYLTSSAKRAFHDYQKDQDIVEAVSRSFYGLLPNEMFKIERQGNRT